MNKEDFSRSILAGLQADNINVLDRFDKFLKSKTNEHLKIEWTHEFIDLLTFKLKQTKSSMNKAVLAEYLLSLVNKTYQKFGYNPKFLAIQFKSLICFYKTRKDYKNVIKILEFLIQKGISDDDCQRFHFQLDEMYRLNQKKKLKEDHFSASG